jgi:DNA-binding XRE family transcriptional regulator
MKSHLTHTESCQLDRRTPSHLAQLRFCEGFTSQLAFARATGLGRSTIVRIENGSTPRLSTAATISRVLDSPIEAIWPELLDA